jgi:putative methyltransferase (TIGR04325 family)
MNSSVSEQDPNNVWDGVYPTWERACSVAHAIGGKGLGGEAWFQRITGQLLDYREEIRRHGVAMPPRPSNLALHCGLTSPSTIVDFGGSSGWCWDYLQESGGGGDSISEYIVVETQEVVDYMKDAALQAAPVRFQTMDEPIGSADLLYCNSVLQYFGSNDPFLSLVERTQPQFILLDDLVAGAGEEFFSIQLFRGSAIPYRFLGLKALLNDLESSGYVERASCPYASPIKGVVAPLLMENFPPARRVRYTMSFLLQRKDPK